jgi:DegV family protein with EDD domain
MSVAVVTDSTSDIEQGQIDGIDVVPLHLHFGDEVFDDGINLSKADFWRRMRRILAEGGELPTTSQPSPGAFRDRYARLLAREGVDEIVSVHISGKLSGTVNSARQGASLLENGATVEVVDTLSASLGTGWAAEAALAAVQTGATAAEAAQAARETAERVQLLLFVETLDYLLRGGRIGRARHLAGRLLRMRPLLEVVDGEIADIERPRTRKKALDRLFAHIMSQGQPERVGILHGATPGDADALARRVSDACGGMPVGTVLSTPVIGAHVGPGTVGVAIMRPA